MTRHEAHHGRELGFDAAVRRQEDHAAENSSAHRAHHGRELGFDAADVVSISSPAGSARVTRHERPRTLRDGANQVAAQLRDAGFQAWFAGGCVRDSLLGVEPKDYDIVTDATPEQVGRLFKRTLMIGAAFGVAKVLLGKDRDYEVATFRTDSTYSDGRHPDAVKYSQDPKEDVERRDFTLNALLMDPVTDEIVDHVGGRADLQKGLIRAVGEPALRFSEDRLRMLRAVRFAARFGFKIEDQTLAAIRDNAAGLSDVSAERITQELAGIFRSARPELGARLLADSGLLAPALPFADPDAAAMVARFDRFAQLSRGLDDTSCFAVALALAFPLDFRGNPERQLGGLRLSRDEQRGVKRLLGAKDALFAAEAPEAAVVRLAIDPDAAAYGAFLHASLGPDSAPAKRWAQVQADLAARPLPPLPLVTGADLVALGLRPGPAFKALLEGVETEILERRITTKEEALAWLRSREL